MSKTKVISAPPLRKTQSSPSMLEPDIPPLPAELQQQLAVMRGDTMPEKWMCVVRREKMNYAVGRIIQVGKLQNIVRKDDK